ncbi:MAG: ATP-dependent DNA helicase RecG [Rikenellaceae bacterium]|jgi:ATP-dependent DNA helicase RecG|nr:ATP-dependent DNA helicase RecG [Rikenellaceae bacterium]
MGNALDRSVMFLPGVGEVRAKLLEKELGVRTVGDLLYYFPYRYIDRSKFFAIREVDPEESAYIQLRVRVEGVQLAGGGPKKRLVVHVRDASGSAELVFFQHIAWNQKQLEVGREYIIFGRPAFFNGRMNFVHPEVGSTLVQNDRFHPETQGVYSTTERLNTQHLGTRKIFDLVCAAWQVAEREIEETLPADVIRAHELMGLREALLNVHFPANANLLKQARLRLKFEELLGIQLQILSQRNARVRKNRGYVFRKIGDRFNTFYNEKLPFELTGAQKRVLKEIRADMATGRQMNRLLQGDVGSGKTLVALMSALIAVDNGFQACIMAPTEILATQHYHSISRMTRGMVLRVALLKGSTGKKERNLLLPALEAGEIDLLIGTHALIEDNVRFSKLGFVVIDEQHRFGVEQRARLWNKGDAFPHILVMTATPIPRTLAMTLYGDLDVSVIDELPAGRKPIRTVHYFENSRLKMFGFIRQQIALGRQIYIVYPLIQESEKMDYADLEDGYAGISAAFPPPDFVTLAVHGRMKAAEKDFSMDLFKRGKAHILVATSVIEVGVDVPNASVMVIESAERFGLSQLHQLRGRVGRGAEQSYCVLMTSYKLSRESRKRIEAMVATNDGFELAELDLKLRGPGDLQGTQQSGLAFDLKIADLARDGQVLQLARDAAEKILAADPLLETPANACLRALKDRYSSHEDRDFSMIS